MDDKPDCRTCEHKGTDFYYSLCPQTDADILPQEGNRCFYCAGNKKLTINLKE